jgi:hypothetical protein
MEKKATRKSATVSGKRVLPPKKDNALLIAGGVGGGALVLLIIIVAASSSRREPTTKPAPPVVRAPVERAPEGDRSVSDTGSIMFVCPGTGKHEEKEVFIRQCPNCPASSRFFFQEGHYTCQACSKPFDNAKVVCPECGHVPRVHRIKHR